MKKESEKQYKVLYLSRWYPHRYDPMPGLFIQRHAEAANIYDNIGVVYVHADTSMIAKKFEVVLETINNVKTVVVYYKAIRSKIPLFSQLCKITRFYRANFIGIRQLKNTMGKFDLVHIHILTRLGLLGLYYKWFKNTNYVVSEHWSRYLTATADFGGFFRKHLSRVVAKNASCITTVTANLAKAMKSHNLYNENYKVLANVLSPEFLNHEKYTEPKLQRFNITHVSCFEDKSKNISGILRVAKIITDGRDDVVFTLVGDGMDFQRIKDYAGELKIKHEKVIFTGLKEGEKLVSIMSASSALLIFSNYENLPVVINESLSLGVPVISTDVGGISEYLNKDNGILIPAGNEEYLIKVLTNFLDGKYKLDSEKFMQKARHDFSMETVGKQLHEIYQKAIN